MSPVVRSMGDLRDFLSQWDKVSSMHALSMDSIPEFVLWGHRDA